MAEDEKKVVGLDDEALEEVAGGDGSGTKTYSVHCFQCGNQNGCLGTGLSFYAATDLADAHNDANEGHNALAVPEK